MVVPLLRNLRREFAQRGRNENCFAYHGWQDSRPCHYAHSCQTQRSFEELIGLQNQRARALSIHSHRLGLRCDDEDDDDDEHKLQQKTLFTNCCCPHVLHSENVGDGDDNATGAAILPPQLQEQTHSLAIASIQQLNVSVDALLHLHRPQPTQTYLSLLQACNKFKGLFQAKQVHAHILLHGPPLNSFLADYLVMTLAKCGAVDDARELYVTLHHRTIFSCTAILSAYVERGEAHEALKIYRCMQEDGMEPDSYTFVSLFKACGSVQDLESGMDLHSHACKKGITLIPQVSNTLMSMYGKCGAVTEAEDLFCAQFERNIVSWTTMLSAYIDQGQAGKALRLYRQMQEEKLDSDQFAFVFALQACGILVDKEQAAGQLSSTVFMEIAQALHAGALRKGYVCDVFVGTALLSVYGKCGILLLAENVFRMLTVCSLVTWNAMLSAYMDKGQEEKALLLYSKMQKEAIEPEQLTFVIAFQACGNIAEKEKTPSCDGNSSKVISLKILQALHADFCIAEERSMNTIVATALLSSYAKCGAVVEAENAFKTLSHRDVVSWNAMLTAYVEQGEGEKAICLYRLMQEQHRPMDDVTMIITLLACSETGSLEMCNHLHFGIVSRKFDMNLLVAATLIHAYGNCARMTDAQVSFDVIPDPDIASWNSCIAGHSGEGSSAATFCMFESAKLGGMKADEVAFTSVLAACTHTGLICEGLESFESMRIDFGVIPDLQHYSILVDLLARAGDFKKVENMLGRVHMQGNLNTWLFLLGACHTHSNIELAKQAFGHAVRLQPKQATAYVLMSNIYANAEVQG